MHRFRASSKTALPGNGSFRAEPKTALPEMNRFVATSNTALARNRIISCLRLGYHTLGVCGALRVGT
jgi:hypothetical protein